MHVLLLSDMEVEGVHALPTTTRVDGALASRSALPHATHQPIAFVTPHLLGSRLHLRYNRAGLPHGPLVAASDVRASSKCRRRSARSMVQSNNRIPNAASNSSSYLHHRGWRGTISEIARSSWTTRQGLDGLKWDPIPKSTGGAGSTHLGQRVGLGPGFARLIDGRFVSRRAAQGGSMRQPHGCFGRRSPLGETARRDSPERDGAGACVWSCGNGRDKLGVRGWQKWRWEQFGVGRVPDARAVLGALVCRAASLTRNVVICGSSGGPGYDNW